MNNIEIEDFYHHDFTTATEWEVFIARLEEIMHEWKVSDKRNGPSLKSGDFVNFQWKNNTEKVHFAGILLIIVSFFIFLYLYTIYMVELTKHLITSFTVHIFFR